jgi:hypothetical protein
MLDRRSFMLSTAAAAFASAADLTRDRWTARWIAAESEQIHTASEASDRHRLPSNGDQPKGTYHAAGRHFRRFLRRGNLRALKAGANSFPI